MKIELNRVHGLDLLRGMCAILVVLYHMALWTQNREVPTWGLHSVYIFFVLSGASLTLAYGDKIERGFSARSFLLLRFARLAPLFVLASAIMFAYRVYSSDLNIEYTLQTALSGSLLFGLGNPGTNSTVPGGWSIGIEVVFYLMFPVLLAFSRGKYSIAIAVLVSLVQFAFVETTLWDSTDVKVTWQSYTQPLAFFAYFFCGCVLGNAVLSGRGPKVWLSRISFSGLFIALVCLSGSTTVTTVTGARGMLLFVISIVIVWFAAFLRPVSRFALATCQLAGDASYGIYLLHPIVYLVLKRLWPTLGVYELVFFTITLAVGIAVLLERKFERPIRSALREYIVEPRATPSRINA